ncbi:hypothetical protein [Burkholderia sp. ABCPW 11]|nr:hypothetical protein [Burkholderia sp. ABCPW 11]
MGGGPGDGKLNIRLGVIRKMNATHAAAAVGRHANCGSEDSIHIDISGGVMQRYSFRHVSRAVFAGILIAGLAAGAGCQKKGDNGAASSDSGAASGMSAAPSTAPSGMPGSGAAGSSGDTGASMPGAASGPAGASGG